MSTNYYLYKQPDCKCCGRPFDPLHIGQSSNGWCFALHVMPEDNINTLDDWIALWSEPQSFIRDEYDKKVSTEDMMKIITDRSSNGLFPEPRRRHIDGGYCIGHGPGTWDYIVGEFS